MKFQVLLGTGLCVAALVAACGADDQGSLQRPDPGNGDDTTTQPTQGGAPGNTQGVPSSGTDPGGNSPSAAGEQYFTANVMPILATNCGGCHNTAGPGPFFVNPNDEHGTYGTLFQLGYVTLTSAVLTQIAHDGQTANFLTDPQKATYTTWVNMELSATGGKSPPSVFSKLGPCMDQTLFNAIGLDKIRTITRNNNNNTNNITPWNENANRCTGCDNAPCKDCHTSDPESNFVMAIGYAGQINGLSAADYTFQQTKLSSPQYLQHYFGTDAGGNPIASHAIENKQIATTKDVAYSHPYFTLTPAQITAIQAFVDDAITKYKAGTCTGTAAPGSTP